MRLCVAGAYGAFGTKHLEAIDNIEGVTVTSVMGPSEDKINALAADRGIGHAATDLAGSDAIHARATPSASMAHARRSPSTVVTTSSPGVSRSIGSAGCQRSRTTRSVHAPRDWGSSVVTVIATVCTSSYSLVAGV